MKTKTTIKSDEIIVMSNGKKYRPVKCHEDENERMVVVYEEVKGGK